jgi:hypothetical protein
MRSKDNLKERQTHPSNTCKMRICSCQQLERVSSKDFSDRMKKLDSFFLHPTAFVSGTGYSLRHYYV